MTTQSIGVDKLALCRRNTVACLPICTSNTQHHSAPLNDDKYTDLAKIRCVRTKNKLRWQVKR